MKKTLLTLSLCCMAGTVLLAQNAANIQEASFFPNNPWDKPDNLPANMNAYSHASLTTNLANGDVYVFTWDNGLSVDLQNAGFAVVQYPAGTAVTSSATPSYFNYKNVLNGDFGNLHITSLEAGLLRRNDSVFIALSYYANPSGSSAGDYFLSLYLWNNNAPNQLQLLTTYNLSQVGNLTKGWIHQDVNNLDSIAIVWEQNGNIFSKVGYMTASSFHLSGNGELSLPASMSQPDVTMMRQSNGEVNLHFVMTTADKLQLLVYESMFNTFSSIPSNTTSPVPVTNVYTQTTTGSFGVPRIDAPDNFQVAGQETVWSTVVANHVTGHDYISATTFSSLSGFHTKNLNDGSLGPNDISSTGTNIYSRRPVVAFSANNLDVYYAWVFRNQSWYSTLPTTPYSTVGASDLSVKTTLDLQILNNPNYYYFIVPHNNNYANNLPAVALSPQNDESPLFTAFTYGSANSAILPYFGYKTADWTSDNGFKPGNATAIHNAAIADTSLVIFPNPFGKGFRLRLDNAGQKPFQLVIYNISGEKVYRSSGNISRLNKGLDAAGERLAPGNYLLELSNKEGNVYRKKIVKR